MELVDFDHDGDLDVVVSCYSSDRLDLFTNPGNGTLVAAGNIAVGDGPTHITKGKFNADNNTDLAVVNNLTGTGGRSLSILIGNAGTGFTESKLTVSGQRTASPSTFPLMVISDCQALSATFAPSEYRP